MRRHRHVSWFLPLVTLSLVGLGWGSLHRFTSVQPDAVREDLVDLRPPGRLATSRMLAVHYFRGDGGHTDVRFAVQVPPHQESRLFGTIRRLEPGSDARPESRSPQVAIEQTGWAANPSNPLLRQSSTVLPPGRYWLELSVMSGASATTIDRVLDVPAFPAGELGLSSVVAVLESESSWAQQALRSLAPQVDRRFPRGRALTIVGEAYFPACLPGLAPFGVRFILSRGERVVREKSYRLNCAEREVPTPVTFDTSMLEPGPYLFEAQVSLSDRFTASSRLELSIDDDASANFIPNIS